MAFSDDFKACLAPLPTPSEALDSLGEALEFIDKWHQALEAAGGDVEITLGAVAALGAAAGVDEAVLEVAGEAAQVTVMSYVTACAGCAVKVGGADAVRSLLATANDGFAKDQMQAALDPPVTNTAVA